MKLNSFTNPEELSYFCTLLLQNSADQMNNSKSRKRRRKDDEDNTKNNSDNECGHGSSSENYTKKEDLKGILTSLLLREDEDKHEEALESQKDALEEATHKKKSKAILECYNGMQESYTDINCTNGVKNKRMRNLGGVGSVVAAVEGSEKAENMEGGKLVGGGGGGAGTTQHRRLWVKDRSKAWWDEVSSVDYPEDEFRKAFRMSRGTFDMICEELNSVIAKEDTTLRNAIPVRQRVAVCIWRLATGEPLRLVSKKFGLGISTCHKLVLEVCSALKNVLMPKFLHWPDDSTLRKIKEEFESVSGIPNVVGSMYTTHIPIIAPKISVAAYFNKRHTERNQKTSYSITVQGVVDHRGVFTDVCIGWPGSMPDDQVLEKSALYQRANGGLLKGMWIGGSSGYPLTDWVLVPYAQPSLTWTQHAFNEKIGEIQKAAKDAFSRLKGRWSCLQKRTEVKLQDLPVVLGACCVLHNICESRNEELDPELMFELNDDEMVSDVPLRSQSSMKARDAIAHNLLHHSLAGTGFL